MSPVTPSSKRTELHQGKWRQNGGKWCFDALEKILGLSWLCGKKMEKNLEKLLLLVCKFKELQCQLLSLQIFGHHRAPAFQQGLAKQARSGEENPQWNGG